VFYQIEVEENTHTVFVVTNRGLLLSHDLGQSWCISDISSNVLDLISGLAISNSTPGHVYVTANSALGKPATLYLSQDAGMHFRAVYSPAKNGGHNSAHTHAKSLGAQ